VQPASQWFLNNMRLNKETEFITSTAQAAPGTAWGLPPGVMVFAHYKQLKKNE
jgi:hypothetical protein